MSFGNVPMVSLLIWIVMTWSHAASVAARIGQEKGAWGWVQGQSPVTGKGDCEVRYLGSGQERRGHEGSDGCADGKCAVAHVPEKIFKSLTTVDVHKFGAVGDGVTDDREAFVHAIRFLAENGGGTLAGGGRRYVYRIDSMIVIKTADNNNWPGAADVVTSRPLCIDMQWARMIGDHRFAFVGDSGIDGDWSMAIRNCYFINARLGDDNLAGTEKTRGPLFYFAEDCGAANVIKKGISNTGFNLSMCRRCFLKNIENYRGKDCGNGSIGFLLLHCYNCVLENCHVREGPWYHGIQVKGGYDNRVTDCSCKDWRDGRNINYQRHSAQSCFRDRGDAPWGRSRSGGTYPYADGDWNIPDKRRASHGTIFSGCRCENVEAACFEVGEAIDTKIRNFDVKDATWGISASKCAPGGGREKGLEISNGRMLRITKIPSSYALAGQMGIKIVGKPSEAGEAYPGVKVSNVIIDTCAGYCIGGYHLEGPVIENVVVRSAGEKGRQAYGVLLDHCTNEQVIEFQGVRDDRVTP